MSKTFQVTQNTIYQGVQYPANRTVEADSEAGSSPIGGVGPAIAGTLTLRTDNDTGELTLTTGHGITTGQRVDVYWSTGSRIGMTAGVVAGDVVPVDGGTGDNLPVLSSVISAMVPHEEDVTVTGNNAQGILASAALAGNDSPATVVFATAVPANIAIYELTGNQPSIEWDADYPSSTNPLAGQTVGKIFFSHGNTDAARAVVAAILYN